MSHEILGWIFVFLIAVLNFVTIKWVIVDPIRTLKAKQRTENTEGDGI